MGAAFAYGLTRMHARLAARPTNEARRRLLAIADFGHFLQAASRAGFRLWLHHLAPESGPHPVELAIRLAFRDRLAEIGRWLPERWQPPLEWLAVVPSLPALDRMLAGEPAPGWLAHDPELAPLAEAGPEQVRGLLALTCPGLETAEPGTLDAVWLARMREALPEHSDAVLDLAETLLREQMVCDPHRVDVEALELTFRRRAETPLRILAYTALLRLDFEFLRGQLARRRLLSGEARVMNNPGEDG